MPTLAANPDDVYAAHYAWAAIVAPVPGTRLVHVMQDEYLYEVDQDPSTNPSTAEQDCDETWFEFLGPPGKESSCGLCGDQGVVDTRGHVTDRHGDDCGIRAFCICPNGRQLKQTLDGKLPAETSKV